MGFTKRARRLKCGTPVSFERRYPPAIPSEPPVGFVFRLCAVAAAVRTAPCQAARSGVWQGLQTIRTVPARARETWPVSVALRPAFQPVPAAKHHCNAARAGRSFGIRCGYEASSPRCPQRSHHTGQKTAAIRKVNGPERARFAAALPETKKQKAGAGRCPAPVLLEKWREGIPLSNGYIAFKRIAALSYMPMLFSSASTAPSLNS